ncbi:MAG: hypothetical protein NC111_06425 [Bacteroides sp.]|nr:hypothetical protein [Bacteroides sp.]MCM1413117.1 hypothetical protein [Bacteroides sp.]MCM1472141.1 hypothetical protein [Bacteroides sp.]
MSKEAEKAKGVLSKLGTVNIAFNSLTGVVSNLNNALQSLTQGYTSFDTAMRQANTMAGKSGADFENLKKQVSGLAKEIPMTRDALASGLYQVISNGVPEDNWISFLRQSSKAAVGGLADLNKVTKS